MSGLEVAGVVLGAFPLIISGLEHWREAAKVSGFLWRVRKENTKCRRDMKFHEIVYKRNLRELLLPIVKDADEVTRLVDNPDGKEWKSNSLQERLEERLQDSYGLYMDIIREMNEVIEELRKTLSLDNVAVQSKLAPPELNKEQRPPSPQSTRKPSIYEQAKSKWEYETFRLKFSFNEPVRKDLLDKLNECNRRLEKLLSTSDRPSALQNVAPANRGRISALKTLSRKTGKKSDLLFKALQNAWQCSCQQHHVAHLRLEHRILPEICFEIILMFTAPSPQTTTPWSWRELRCGRMIDCPFPQKITEPSTTTTVSCTPPVAQPSMKATPKKVGFIEPSAPIPKIELDIEVDSSIKLCQLLCDDECNNCMGVISHDDETYHLHPFNKRKRPDGKDQLTLGHILSSNFEGHLTRRQRYSIALLLASSVAQLQFTPWLRTDLTKEDVFFFPCNYDHCTIPYHEPFIRQGFPRDHAASPTARVNECNFYALGVLLLELCFGRPLEDHPLRKRHPPGAGEAKKVFDYMAALKWSQSVSDEGGDDYASAVKWCFIGTHVDRSWRGEIIENVIRPLEICQEHFKTSAVS